MSSLTPSIDSDEALEAASGTGAYEWRPAEDRLVWSPGLRRIYGLAEVPKEEASFSRLVHPDDRTRVEAETLCFLSGDAETYSHTFRIVRPDGAVRFVLDRGIIVRDANGQVVAVRGINVDLTDVPLPTHKERVADLRTDQRLAELGALYAEVPLGLALLDSELRFVRLNSALAEINGYPVEAHIGRRAWDLLPALRDSAEPALRQVLETGLPLRHVAVKGETPARPGVIREWREHFYPLRGANGRVEGIGIVCEEVTDQLAAERALAENERRFKLVLAGSPITVFEHDSELRYEWLYNSKLGYSDTFCIGKTDEEIMDPEPARALIAFKRRVMESGEPGREECVAAAPGQPMEYYDLYAFPRRDESGRVIGLNCVSTDITDKKRAEIALVESEARFREMADNAPVMVWVTDPSGTCTYLNGPWYEFTGQTAEDGLGFGWLNAVHPADAAEAGRVFREASARRESFRLEYRLRRADGAWRWAIDSGRPRNGPNGTFLGYIGSVIDITERKSAEEALRDSEVRFRALVTASSDVVYRMSPDWREMRYLQGREFTLSTVDPGDGWLERYVHSEDRDQVLAAIDAAIQSKSPFALEHRVIQGDGSPRWTSSRAIPLLDGDGNIVEWFGASRDITDRKAAEEALRTAHDTFRHLVERSPFGVYVVDADFRLVLVSQGAQRVFQNVRPLVGRDFAEVLRIVWPEPFASEAIGHFRRTLMTGAPYRAPSTVERRADIDATETYDWEIERITLPGGRPGVMCHFYDLSERQSREEKIQYLMREVNHRAKNMLTLVGAVARQTAWVGPEDFLDRFSARIQALAASQDLLIRTDWERADLAALIESQVLHFKDLMGTRITLDGPPIEVSPQAAQTLGMAVHEMATNAVKHGSLSNQSGRVTISWRIEEEDEIPQFSICWREEGGPPVAAPARHGFGRRVAKTMAEIALSAKVELDYPTTGVVWTLDCPLSSIGVPFGGPQTQA